MSNAKNNEKLESEFVDMIPKSDVVVIRQSPFLKALLSIVSLMYDEDPILITDMLKDVKR